MYAHQNGLGYFAREPCGFLKGLEGPETGQQQRKLWETLKKNSGSILDISDKTHDAINFRETFPMPIFVLLPTFCVIFGLK